MLVMAVLVVYSFDYLIKQNEQLLIDLMGKEVLARIFHPRNWQRLEDGTLLLEERTVVDDWSRIEVCWTLIAADGQRVERRFGHRLFSAAELRTMLTDVGFAEVKCFGSFEGGVYDATATRLIACAEKL